MLTGTETSQCVCEPGFYMHPKDDENELRYCAKIATSLSIPESVDATKNSVDIASLPIAEGFWRASSESTEAVTHPKRALEAQTPLAPKATPAPTAACASKATPSSAPAPRA